MKRTKVPATPRLLACATLATLATLTTLASPFASADVSNWYGGINLGQSRAKIDDARITSGLLAGRFAVPSIADDDRDTGYKIFGGYQANKYFAVEGGYFDLGKFGFTANTLPPGSLSGNIKVKGMNLDLVGTLPITERFSAFGRVGANYAHTRDTFAGTGAVTVIRANASTRDTNIKYGAGIQFAMTENLGVRGEVERYRINDAVGNRGDIDLVSIGLVYRFGAKTHAPAPRPIVLAPVAPSPPPVAPPPVVVAPPPPAPVVQLPMKVTFSADSLFDFDKATVKPAGMHALDKFAVDLRGTTFEVISVVGHTDRIGSSAYNMSLSSRRAEAVKSYLVQPAGIPAGKIAARGVGESEPVTKPGDCKGQKATRQLIACLQPDRRVDVEVSGTK
ncbi:MAG: OmpA family protein [Betaproteobacteria bacterium]|nr:OmpA family protein [Betaproteobacteria bacterium]